ncbi:hypothetical protein FQA39_LY16144 [Lamprigera yunnana]|nr:hypothetical protein FQA39_LY16144 [Lamprigera yunnana]
MEKFRRLCFEILALIITCAIGIVIYFKIKFKYWENRNVPYIEPKIPFGTIKNPFRSNTVSLGVMAKQQYDEGKRKGYKHVGLYSFTTPAYMPIDLEENKNILSRDFSFFPDRGFYNNEKSDPLSAHLFSLEGSKWKILRAKLTSTFTSAKMKMMFETMSQCGEQMLEAVDGTFKKRQPIDIKDTLARFGTDVIGSCAFGIDCNSFKNPNSKFRKFTRRVFMRTKFETLKKDFCTAYPSVARYFRLSKTPTDVTDFFTNIIRETVKRREETKEVRNDFLQILIDLKNTTGCKKDEQENNLTIEQVTAQAFLFFIAGFESSSALMTFCLFELSQNPKLQEKVRNEINEVLDNYQAKITYEAVKEMKLLKQVIDETLRKYPPVQILNRKCVMNYKVPGSNFTIEKGTPIIIPLYGLHYDPQYFPNPEEFNPDRFNEENKQNILPYTYMPFGEGPRLCIEETDVTGRHKMEKRAKETTQIIKFFDNLFDSLNGGTFFGGPSKPLKGVVKRNSPHLSFWKEAICSLRQMFFQTEGTNERRKPPSLTNFISTLVGSFNLPQLAYASVRNVTGCGL